MSGHRPTRAQVVIVGGGSIGCNIAYHLNLLGWTDVVVVERDKLTSGTTWHAAGEVVPGLLGDEWACDLYTYGRDLIADLEARTGQATGWRQVGYIQPADTTERVEECRRASAFMNRMGIEVHEVSPAEAAELFPIGDFSATLAAYWFPREGRVNPVDTTMALARGARDLGTRILEDTRVEQILTANGRAVGVRTDKGDIEAEHVVIAAGMWSRQIGAAAGINLPLQAAEHYYLITEPIEGVHRDLPLLEDPHTWAYFREEVGGMMIGLFEPDAAPWNIDRIPDDFSFGEIKPDWDRMGPHVELAFSRIPAAADVGVRKLFCGPESFTPDLSPLVGEAPGLRNCWVAAGLNSLGILYGPGDRQGGRALDGRGCVPGRSHRLQRRPLRGRHPQHACVPARPDTGVALEELRRPLPQQHLHDRPRAEAVSPLRPAHHGRGVLHREPRLGAPGLVRTNAGAGPYRPLQLGPSALVRVARRGASCGPAGRRRGRHVLDVEVPRPGSRRVRAAGSGELQRRRRGTRPRGLHGVGERGRRLRGRPHRHPLGGGLVLGRGRREQPRPHRDLAAPAPPVRSGS